MLRNIITAQRSCLALFVLLLLNVTVCSCKRSSADLPEADSSELDARPVRVYVVPEPTAVETRTFPVFVKGGATTKLSFRTPGRLEEFNAEVGRRFQEGEVVARLDARDYQLVVDRAQQALVEARAALKAMETGARPEDVASAEAAFSAARSQRETAEKQYARIDSLRSDGTASEMQYDLAKSTLDAARAAELAAEKTLEKARKGSRAEEIEMIKAKISGLEIDLQLAENKLSDVVLTAPFSGVVSEKFFENHETVAPGLAVATLVDDKSFEGEMSATEELLQRRDSVASVECRFEGVPGKVFPATLKRVSTSVQKGNRSYLATLSVNASAEDGVLIGMVGVATLTLADSSDKVYVPASSLVSNSEVSDTSTSVWVVNEDGETLTRREVEVGELSDDRAEILSGLSSGERIVGAGARFIKEGQKIRLLQDE